MLNWAATAGVCRRASRGIVPGDASQETIGGGIGFYRGKNVVERFPDEVMVEVTITDCASPYAVPVARDILETIPASLLAIGVEELRRGL